MASLYKKPASPFWYFSITPREKELLGKKHDFSSKEKSKKRAEIKLKILKEEIAKVVREGIGVKSSSAYSFLEIFELFKADRTNTGKPLAQNTLSIYKKAFDVFIPAVGNKYITEYSRDDYHTFVMSMDATGYAQNTKAIFTSRIYAIFNWMKAEGYLRYNPMKTVAEKTRVLKTLTDKQILSFVEYANTTKFGGIVKFMLISAFRAEEALNLKVSDIKTNKILVLGKGNKSASIPMTSQLKIVVKNFAPSNGEVFNFNYHALRQFFNRATKNLKFTVKSHDMRKYCLSTLANSGVNIFFVKTFARHSDIKTTLKYYATADEKKIGDEINEKVNFHFL